jgi:membrane protein implicated in regulation of membrane protease activity
MALTSARHSPSLALLLASNVAFSITFGIFVIALAALIVIVLRWAIRRDRTGRVAWRQRQQEKMAGPEPDGPPPPRR